VSNSEKPERMALLDGLRGLAALLVVFYHVNSVHGEKGFVFGQGILAVDFFFLLSGFVLTRVYEKKFSQGLGAMAFMKLRFVRLWPALAVGVLLGAVAHSILTPSPLVFPLIATSLLMVPVFVPGGGFFLLDSVQWSLFFELCANAAHVILFRRLSDRALALVCAISAVLFLQGIVIYGNTGIGGETATFFYGLPRTAFSYSLGILFARRSQGLAPTRSSWWPILLCLVATICGVSMIPSEWRLAGQVMAIFVAFPTIFHHAIRTRVPDAVEPVLLWLGRISYPVYTIHYPIFFIVAYTNMLAFPGTSRTMWDVIAIVWILGMAHGMAMLGLWYNRRRAARRLQARSGSFVGFAGANGMPKSSEFA
jgi:peptidoglycan/LPS O-acetylase OafA/YrhL